MNLKCKIIGHEYRERLYFYPRPGPAPGNQAYHECDRCGHVDDPNIARLLEQSADTDETIS